MNKRQKARLLKLADFLENHVSSRNFDLATFTSWQESLQSKYCDKEEGNWSTYYNLNSNKLLNGLKQKTCGTTACALGWAPVIFNRSLKYDEDGTPIFRNNKLGYDVHNVCVDFFGLDKENEQEHFEYLFTPEAYRKGRRGPKSVARRIKQYVKNDGKIPSYWRHY